MAKIGNKVKKQKLTPAERSQVAKDRWAKIRSNQSTQKLVETIVGVDLIVGQEPVVHTEPRLVPPVVAHESEPQEYIPDQVVYHMPPAPQPAPVAPKKPKTKRVNVPKEFLAALKTADQLLAKALEEYEHCEERISYLRKAIPRLQRTVQSLRSESNPDVAMTPVPYDFSGSVPNATAFQNPIQLAQSPAPLDLGAIQNAMAQPPVSRAVGNAIQFAPADVGVLEGPEDDDDEDKYLKGPMATGTWV